MILRQTFDKPINGYWDGGPKRIFDWSIDGIVCTGPERGESVQVGSWSANYYFAVKLGKSDKQTLGNARRHLTACAKRQGLPCSFEYIN